MEKWKPINWRGKWNYDPRGELRDRAEIARQNYDDYVAIPVKLALACADFRECGARMLLTHDEDGPLKEPQWITCRRPEGHELNVMHFNGYMSWENRGTV